jgi:hypothetical protein
MSAEYPVVAFLQNCWFKPGTNPETIRRYLSEQKFRRIVLGMSMTGRRLSTAFGEHHYRRIWWDNASEYVASASPGRGDPDPVHMRRVIARIQPAAVLLFGGVALQGFYSIALPEQKFHAFPHPNARGLRQSQLNEFAREIITRYL